MEESESMTMPVEFLEFMTHNLDQRGHLNRNLRF
jgi:hypothetical protein